MFLNFILLTLIELLKKDERKGVKEILKKYKPDLTKFLRIKLCGNDEMTQDLFQETALHFLNAVANKKVNFISEKKIKNFLFTIAMNNFRNFYKKYYYLKKKEKFYKDQSELNTDLLNISNADSPESTALYKEERDRINKIVDMTMALLSDNYKTILELKFKTKKSVVEIAGEMNLSPKACESLLFRAKQLFKKRFKNIAKNENLFFIEEEGKNEGQKN